MKTTCRLCSVGGCMKRVVGRGLCEKHYRQDQRRHAKPLPEALLNPSVQARFWSHVSKSDGCWRWTGSHTRTGYGHFSIAGATEIAHRVSWTLHHGPIPEGLSVLHHCDVRDCIRPDHLFLGTQLDNMRDAAEKGRMVSGERHPFYGKSPADPTGSALIRYWKTHERQRGSEKPNARLSEPAVLAMRAAFDSGVSRADLARQFGLGWTTVDVVVRRVTWRHLP